MGTKKAALGRPGEYQRPGFFWHLLIVLHKTLLLKASAPVSSIIEFTLPALFVVVLIPAWKAAGTKDGKDELYYNEMVDLEAVYNNSKCRVSSSADPSLAGYRDCPQAFVDESRCIADLCIMYPFEEEEQWKLILPLITHTAANPVDFDTLALLRKYASKYELPGYSEWDENVQHALSTGYHVTVVAGSPAYETRAAQLRAYINQTTYTYRHIAKDFGSEEAAMEWAKDEGSTKLWAAIVVSGETDFAIRMNRTNTPSTKEFEVVSQGMDGIFRLYMGSGFVTLQRLVNQFVVGDGYTNFTTVAMPVAAYSENTFLVYAADSIPMVLVFAFLYPVSQMVSMIVKEKEGRLREGMLIMGLSPAAFRLSWFITGSVQMTVTAALMTLFLKISFFSGTDGGIIFLLMWFQGMTTVAFVILISAFFSKASLAALVAPLIFLVTSTPHSAMQNPSTGVKTLLSILFNNFAFAEGCELLSKYEAKGAGMQSHNLNDDDFSMNNIFGSFVIGYLIYVILGWYFDKVIPGEWGQSKPFYFCCAPWLWFSNPPKVDEDAKDGALNPEMVEAVTDPPGPESVRTMHLRKEFSSDGKKVAVNNLNFRMYEGQIQVLLGHNGAGKTTFINLLTGMLPASSGDAQIFGKSVHSEMEAIRSEVGLCPQHNILWDQLTCAQHLRFYARLKGVPSGEVEGRVEEMLREVELGDKKDERASALSGGMKRKLSVGIALIGAPRLVILDEPTAGMDVQARRAVWNLLKRSRENRTVLLTTHYMDEADLLGDSIAIMHGGRLHSWGSSMFLKSRLGAGYNLKLEVAGARRAGEIGARLEELTEGPVELVSSAGSELSYRLPLAARPAFPAVFRELEERGEGLGVRGYGMSVTTLEEIFIKIAHDALPPGDGEERERESAKVYPDNEVHVNVRSEAFTVPEEDRKSGAGLLRSQFTGLVWKRFHYMKRDRRTLCLQLLLPVVTIVFALLLNVIDTSDLPSLDVTVNDKRTLFPFTNSTFSPSIYGDFELDVQEGLAGPAEMDRYLLDTFDMHGKTPRWQAWYSSETDGDVYWFNTSRKHSLPVAVSVAANARLRAGMGSNTTVLRVTNHPLPYSKFFKALLKGWDAVTVGLLILIPFTFIPSNFVGFLVKEREIKAKHVQLVSGVRLSTYWLSTFVWDFASFLVTALLAFMVFGIFNRKEYIGDAETGFALLMLFLLYGCASAGAAYTVSFFFESHTRGQNVVMLTSFLCGFVLVIVANILLLIPSTKSAGEVCRHIFRIAPPFCLGDGIIQLAQRPSMEEMGLGKGAFDLDVTGYDMIYLAIFAPIYFLVAMAHDFPELLYILHLRKPPAPSKGKVDVSDSEDDDVRAERLEVEEGREGDVVTVKHLRKVYPAKTGSVEKVAVKDVTFGVKGNEIFAFLGTNGAGKTTTLSVLSGDFPPTAGEASINGFDVVKELGESRRQLGYCPQFDGLIDLLTPKEHLELFASLRGIPSDKRRGVIDSLLSVLDLTSYQDTRCKSLSGGNKRKTSIAIALIGGPACLMLDEPTAGMDPVARRSLWTALQQLGEGRCVILTTHHLEEVEALAHRVAIMVDGGLRCMGSLTHLKNKFGGSYQMEMKVESDEAEERAKGFIREAYPEAVLAEETNHRLTYTIRTTTLRLSDLFSTLEENKGRVGIVDYSVSQTSLEQVFIAICRRSLEE